MNDVYNRKGEPISYEEWARIRKDEKDEKRVAEDTFGDYWISTVWLGLDHSYGNGPPLIFETMIFSQKDGEVTSWSELYGTRYSTEAEAKAGHDKVVAALKAGTKLEDLYDEE